MDTSLDIQRDHDTLIKGAMARLAPQGTLYFSTHLRRFKIAPALIDTYQVEDISPKTLDEDFKRRPHAHKCYKISAP